MNIEQLTNHFDNIYTVWHASVKKWQVVADTDTYVFRDCKWVGWGTSLDEAVEDLSSYTHTGSRLLFSTTFTTTPDVGDEPSSAK